MPEVIEREKQIVAIATKPSANNVEWFNRHIAEEQALLRESQLYKNYKRDKARLECRRNLYPKLSDYWAKEEKFLREKMSKEFTKFNAINMPSAKEACEKATAGVK